MKKLTDKLSQHAQLMERMRWTHMQTTERWSLTKSEPLFLAAQNTTKQKAKGD